MTKQMLKGRVWSESGAMARHHGARRLWAWELVDGYLIHTGYWRTWGEAVGALTRAQHDVAAGRR